MKVKTGCELETLLTNQQHFFFFSEKSAHSLPLLLVIYLSVLKPLPRVNSDSYVYTLQTLNSSQGLFPETQPDVSHQGAYFQSIELFNAVFGQRLSRTSAT